MSIPGGPTFVAVTFEGDVVAADDNLDALLFELLSAVVIRHGREELVIWAQGSPDTVAAVLQADGRTIRLDSEQPRVQLPPRRNGRHNAQDRSGQARRT